MNPRWLLRAKLWARNPPSPAKIKFVAAIIVLCIVLFAIERLWGWPAWLTPNDLRRPR
ncbi:MAG: hypothetical protein NWQ23_06315 [Yoonia sp.]|uniref:hypothetical protein n=1 Tax=Yoonia sp. TaxID=2212373 RepID=UPI00273EAF53|nr:hypothetical protein [Yoonia sp.]MDP5085017.1 hypothetical protein [Yoonia sp.]MDP5362360.1 hypothetical protein [Paracoccaceae bacterium]